MNKNNEDDIILKYLIKKQDRSYRKIHAERKIISVLAPLVVALTAVFPLIGEGSNYTVYTHIKNIDHITLNTLFFFVVILVSITLCYVGIKNIIGKYRYDKVQKEIDILKSKQSKKL